MIGFQTVEEKALQWGLTSRHIQSLCRDGKIEGAIKRAGSWFIPEHTHRAGRGGNGEAPRDGYLIFRGTKRKIFERAIDLFSSHSYELVSIKDIADSVGIRQSAVYNHFDSKQEILGTIYNFFQFYFVADRPTLDDQETILREGSLHDIIRCVTYEFNSEYSELLVSITKIIFQRTFIDEDAKNIFRDLIIEGGMRYCEDIFNRAIAIGRLAPFDTRTLAQFSMNNRFFLLWSWIINPVPDHYALLLTYESRLIDYATMLVKDLKSPKQS